MSALLRKDCYVLLRQAKIFIAIIVVLSLMGDTSSSVIAVMFSAMLPVTAFAYDERSDFQKLAKALPYSVWALTASKYVMGYVSLLMATLLVSVTQTVVGGAFPLSFFFFTVWAGAMVIALTIPLMVIFGAEKGRMFFIFGIFGLTIASQMLLDKFPVSAGFLQPQGVDVLAYALLLVVTALSMVVSMKFNGRKLS